MKRTRNVLLLVLAVLLLFPWTLAAAGTEIIGTVDTEENALISAQLEAMAEEYVTKYIHTAYLYEEEDFVTGTLLEMSEETLAKTGLTTLKINGTEEKIADLQANLQQFADVAWYYMYTRSYQDIERYDFDISIRITDAEIEGTNAFLKIYTLVSFKYEPDADTTMCGDHFQVTFTKVNNRWYISDIISEEMLVYGLTRDVFDCQEAITVFNNSRSAIETTSHTVETICEPTVAYSDISITSSTVPFFRNYNTINAVAYAYTYTTDTYTAGTGNDPNFLNGNFYDFSNYGGNCQNFASQCVWAGLYGNNSEDSISNSQNPMDTDGNASGSWYNDGGWGLDQNHNWISCGNFANYVTSSATTYNQDALKASVYTVPANGNFGSITESRMLGAVLHVYGNGSNYSHAIFVTRTTGVHNSNIFFCANSPMRQNANLSDYYNFINHSIRVIVPSGFQTVSSCTGHIYSASSTCPEGYSTKCSKCSYSDLYISGALRKPTTVGSAVYISATTNHTCYRMALNIKHSDGTSIWYEYLNTDTISQYYTFTKSGLYTIGIYARDGNDSVEDNTNTASHIFTIRVTGG